MFYLYGTLYQRMTKNAILVSFEVCQMDAKCYGPLTRQQGVMTEEMGILPLFNFSIDFQPVDFRVQN